MRYLIPLVLTFNVTYLYAQAIDFNSEFDKSISVSDATVIPLVLLMSGKVLKLQ